jgi:hypothetical protein
MLAADLEVVFDRPGRRSKQRRRSGRLSINPRSEAVQQGQRAPSTRLTQEIPASVVARFPDSRLDRQYCAFAWAQKTFQTFPPSREMTPAPHSNPRAMQPAERSYDQQDGHRYRCVSGRCCRPRQSLPPMAAQIWEDGDQLKTRARHAFCLPGPARRGRRRGLEQWRICLTRTRFPSVRFD